MSVRSPARLHADQSDEVKEATAAPIAAISSTRRATRKRDADDEPQQPQQAAEGASPAAASASASSVPDPKRPRRSSRVRQSASAVTEQNAAAAGDGKKVPHAAGAKSDEGSTAGNEQQSASNEGDADAAMAEATDSSLDSLRVSTVGHMFSAATVAGRPALPLHVVARVCDFLTSADIVLRIAPTARASYATAVEYARMVAQSVVAASAPEATPAASEKQSSRKRGGGSRAAAADAAGKPFSIALDAAGCSIGHRSEVSVFKSVRALTLLCTSRLRSVVSGIRTRNAKTDEEVLPLDARLLSRISDAIPTLASLECPLSSSSVQPAFDFPVSLRDLNLSLMFFTARPVPAAKRESRFTELAESWSMAQCDAFAEWAVGKAAALPSLTTLTLSTCASPHRSRSWRLQSNESPKPSWIEPLVSASSLRHLTCDLYTSGPWPSTLRKLVQLQTLSGALVHKSLAAIFAELQHFKRLKRIPLENVQLTPALLQSLQRVSRSLTDLRPHSLADVSDLSFLHDFTRLRRLDLFEQDPVPPYFSYSPVTYTEGATAPTALHVVETIESLSTARRAQIESIGVGSDSWNDELVLRLLTALPGLMELELRSKAVTSLAAFSVVASLRSSLKVLRLQTPSVPRDDVTHLHALLQLESLSIAGSFSEPLYAKQLFPFLPPYPKQPLHWLRAFVPRSAKEPVPTPPVDPAAKAAADVQFDARVRAGGVSAAQLLNSAQLSCVMQFLDMSAFSIAARACRSWRAAACLPSAWSLSSPAVVDGSDSDPLVSGVSPSRWFGVVGYSFNDNGTLIPPTLKARNSATRALQLHASQPHCRPSVLPGLPLWLNAKSVVLKSDWYPSLESDRQAMLAIQQLLRLESLETTVSFRSEAAGQLLMQLGPRLQLLECSRLPPAALSHLSALTELKISGCAVDGDFSVLHQLRRLTLVECAFGQELAIALRALSRDHALRELNVVEPAGGSLVVFLHALAGLSVGTASAADVVPHSAPALLERLRIAHRRHSSIASVLSLPQLRCFELWSWGSDPVDLSPLETLVRDSLTPIEVLHISASLHRHACQHIGLLLQLRELRLTDVSSWVDNPEEPSVGENNPRWASCLLQLQRLEVLELEAVEIHPLDVALLDQLPKLRALTLNRQKSLRVSDLAMLPRIRGLAELQLDSNPLLLLQKRDWLKDNGRQLPGESAVAAAETGAQAAAQSMQDDEEQKVDTGAESAPAAAAAATSSVPALPADTDGMLPLLLQCRSLRLLRWSSPAAHLTDAERYTSRHSWVRSSSSVRSTQLQQHRKNKEYARERQALRTLLSANPLLSVEAGAYSDSIRPVVLPPRNGSIAEAEVTATAESARKLGSSYEYDKVVSDNPSLQAFEDRALLAIEAEEELEWRADAERKAATKPKRRNKY